MILNVPAAVVTHTLLTIVFLLASPAGYGACQSEMRILADDLAGVKLNSYQTQTIADKVLQARRHCWVHREKAAMDLIRPQGNNRRVRLGERAAGIAGRRQLTKRRQRKNRTTEAQRTSRLGSSVTLGFARRANPTCKTFFSEQTPVSALLNFVDLDLLCVSESLW